MVTYKELFYEQYLTFLGQPIDREVYRYNASMPNGAEQFEDLLEEKEMDPFHIARESII